MSDRVRRLTLLASEELVWQRAKHTALLRGNTQDFKRALDELKRIKTAIFAEGRQPQQENPHA